jgi:hypothetical protein
MGLRVLLLCLPFFTLISVSRGGECPERLAASPLPLRLELSYSVSDDGDGDDEDEGETEEKDEDGEVKKTFWVTKLPFRWSSGNVTVSVEEEDDVVVDVSYSYGDADGTASGSLTLPQQDGRFFRPKQPLRLTADGGDNASGAWGMHSSLEIHFESPDAVPAPDKGKKKTAKRASTGGDVFVFTGALSIARAEATDLVLANGGTVGSSLSKKTTYLVAGEKAGGKLAKAKSLGVKVLTEAEFRKLLGR